MADLEETESSVPTPLDNLMIKLNLTNHDLVAASTEQLTHKMVAKGRKGKNITPNVQNKIYYALKAAKPEVALTLKELFH